MTHGFPCWSSRELVRTTAVPPDAPATCRARPFAAARDGSLTAHASIAPDPAQFDSRMSVYAAVSTTAWP